MSSSRNPRRRVSKGTFVTKSGKTIKLNRSITDRIRARKDARVRKRATYLSTLPKNRWLRVLHRMHPKRVLRYWFSRDGFLMALKLLGAGIVVCFLLLVGVFAYFRKDLPNITDVSGNNLPGSTSYYDRTGTVLLWQDYDAEKRIPVPSDQISPYMKEATVAVEDKSFYHEGAFDIRGITRAAFNDAFHPGGGLQGGSTITQQLVKLNENWTANRTITRKVKEVILAVELEREYSKDTILTGYLNIAPYGGIEYGVEAAARDYFGTSAKALTLPQAAMLAAIPQYPTGYSPYSDPQFNPAAGGNYFDKDGLICRQRYILDQMANQGLITKAQANDAKKVDVLSEVHPLQAKYAGIRAPYFVLAAKHQLETQYGSQTVNRGGWKITTTLDMNLQNLAESLVQSNLPNVERYGADEEAMAGEDVKTGQMVMLVGGVDFTNTDHGQINYAQTNISPGSSFKPYDYVSLINYSKDVGAGSVLYDTQGPLAGYPCTNKNLPKSDPGANCLWDYDFRYPGPLTLRYAIGGSRNVPAVKAMLTVGTNKVISTADAMMGNSDAYKCYAPGTDVGSATKSDETQCYGSSAIGDGAYIHLDEHVNGLSTLARLGAYLPQTYILKIQDASGKDIPLPTVQPKQVVSQDSAYILDNMLSDPSATYLPGSCTTYTCTTLSRGGFKFQHYNGWNLAVKTGTTNSGFDGLMTSWSTQYAVASWVGYHTRNKTLSTSMEYLTEPLTRPWIQGAIDSLHISPVNWVQPSDIKTEPAFVITSHVGIGSIEPSPKTDLYPSWYTPKSVSIISTTIDTVSGKVATSCTPSDAQQVVNGSNANSFSVDQWVTGSAANSVNGTATDDIHNCSDTKPIASTLTTANDTSATDQCDTTHGCKITVTVTQGTYPLSSSKFPGSITLSVNGSVVNTFSITDPSSPQSFTYNYLPTTAGSVSVTAQATDSVLYQTTSAAETVTNTIGH